MLPLLRMARKDRVSHPGPGLAYLPAAHRAPRDLATRSIARSPTLAWPRSHLSIWAWSARTQPGTGTMARTPHPLLTDDSGARGCGLALTSRFAIAHCSPQSDGTTVRYDDRPKELSTSAASKRHSATVLLHGQCGRVDARSTTGPNTDTTLALCLEHTQPEPLHHGTTGTTHSPTPHTVPAPPIPPPSNTFRSSSHQVAPPGAIDAGHCRGPGDP